MPSKSPIPEFRRLRADLEREASKYHDLTLSVFFLVDGLPPPESKQFGEPNHAISLWQYIDHMKGDGDLGRLENIIVTNYGVADAMLNTLGVVEGPETELFCRMARRAGSLLPQKLVHDLTSHIMDNVVDPKIEGKPVFACNPNPLAAWINLVLMCLSTYQPNRFRQSKVTVDPFTASLAVFDHLIDGDIGARMQDTDMPTTLAATRFKVALSYPSEKRDYVERVAQILRENIGSVFYDNFYEAELARPNLDTLLQTIYRSNSDLVVVFLCAEYEQKEWCGLEWRAIRDLIKRRKDDCIMLMRFDDADVSGVLSIDGKIDLRGKTPEQAAALIIERISR